MRKKIHFYLIVQFSILFLFGSSEVFSQKNILFISIDDLRPDLGAYGNTLVKSPNLDALASEGTVFLNNFANVPTCGASRYCLLTGLLPSTKAHLGNYIAEKELSNKPETEKPETFIHHLKRNGYYTVGIGKISHSADGFVYGYTDPQSQKRELPHSWNEVEFNPGKWGTGWNSFFGYANGENRQSLNKKVAPYEKGEVQEDTGYVDGLTALLAIEKLKELKNKNQPFFLGVGFFKPHLPFNSPEKFWDIYDTDQIPISENPLVPNYVNLKSLTNSNEINSYQNGDEKPSLDNVLSEAYSKKLKQAYYSCISYVDQQVGLVLDELKRQGLDENTIVVVWGDHGWHLGDQQVWGKHTLFENSLKSSLIIKVPGKSTPKSINSVVQSVDIFPTLMDLVELNYPYKSDGKSFANAFNGENQKEERVAYSYYNNGISLRTSRYRLTKYFREDLPNIELYDHETDPAESINVAELNPGIVNQLMPILEKGNNGIYGNR